MARNPKALESSDETTRYPRPNVRRAPRLGHATRQHRMTQRLPLASAVITTIDDLREYNRVIRLPDKKGGIASVHLPDFPRIPDGSADLEWGKAAARDFVETMVQCRRQTQVPAAYIAEKMGVAAPVINRLEASRRRGVKLDTVLRYLRAIGLEIEIVELETKQ